MTGAFSWLTEVMNFFGNLVPRLLIIKSTYGGVKYVNGKTPKELSSGLHFYWPIVTAVEVYPIVRQTIELSSQILTTSDGQSVSVGVVVVYSVEDIFTLLTTVYEPEETITDVAKGSVLEVLNNQSYPDLLSLDMGKEIGKKCRANLKRYGIAVERVLIVNFTRVVSINIT